MSTPYHYTLHRIQSSPRTTSATLVPALQGLGRFGRLPPRLDVSFGKSNGRLDHLHDVDPLLGGTDGESCRRNDPRPVVSVGKVGEAQEVEGEEEDLVGGTEGEQDFLWNWSEHVLDSSN
jgi:hypothetical protein